MSKTRMALRSLMLSIQAHPDYGEHNQEWVDLIEIAEEALKQEVYTEEDLKDFRDYIMKNISAVPQAGKEAYAFFGTIEEFKKIIRKS